MKIRIAKSIFHGSINDLAVFIAGLYVAPEIYKDEVFDRSVDAYSFGLIIYEVPDFCITHYVMMFLISD